VSERGVGTTCRENEAARVIASVSEAIQGGARKNLNCFVAIAPRNDVLYP
jgi:hypothetical protein